MSNIKILCTLGPASLNEDTISKMTERGVDCFRINMSHTAIDQLKQHILTIRKYTNTAICIDSEGAQVRTGFMPEGTVLKDRQCIILVPGREMGTSNKIGLWPEVVFKHLKPGSIITVDFDSVLLSVTEVKKDKAMATVINGGSVGNNKAVTAFPSPTLPALSEKDIAAVKIGLEYGVKDFALSFANSAEDVMEFRKIVGKDATIISKIESNKAVRNLDAILEVTDAILIDRGDLSREVPLENIPLLQKLIIKKGRRVGANVFVATNLLESMLVNKKPTRAELNDVMNTLIDGATGLVLAAETAIGKHPVAAVDILRSLIERYKESLNGYRITDLLGHASLLLPKMHGTESFESNSHPTVSYTPRYSEEYDRLEIDENTFLDVMQIAQGVYSPIKGFMDQDNLESVLNNYRLSSGDIWTLPIILQIGERKWRDLKPGMTVALKSQNHPDSQMILMIRELYKIDLENVAKRWFGTSDIKHPGVERLVKLGMYVVAGDVNHYNSEKELTSPHFLKPEQTRKIFTIKGWSKIVAFHTRNVPHRAHEYIMKKAIERSNADGLLIQPVVGPKKKGDYVAEAILGAYDIFIESYFPGALLSTFSTYSRYSGPREAVFTALCRKNYGCTHFIVGRDHTGVGDYYKTNTASKLFEDLGDIGINIIYFSKVQYSKTSNKIIELNESKDVDNTKSISGTDIRNAICKGETIPESIMRKNIVNYLRNRLDNGQPVFVD